MIGQGENVANKNGILLKLPSEERGRKRSVENVTPKVIYTLRKYQPVKQKSHLQLKKKS